MSQFIINLADIVNLDELEKILNAYTNATKMSSLITDYRGNPISTERYFHPICLAIREDPDRRQRCIKCDALGGLNASIKGEAYIYKCHAGLVEVCAPIIIDEMPIANLFTGQMLINEEDNDKIPYITDELTDLFADPFLGPIYTDHLKSAPRLSYEQILSYSTLIIEISNYIAKISYEKILQEKIQTQERKLLERKNIKLKSKLIVNQYNTLFLTEAFNTIYNQAILENAAVTSELLYSFSALFKRNIITDTNYITLDRDLEDILSLMDLFNTTFDQQIKLILNITPNLYHELVPVIGLQPILMNVFLNNLSSNNTKISIHLNIKKEKNLLKSCFFCSHIQFPDINFKSEEDLQAQEMFFSKASFFTLKLVVDHLLDFYSNDFEMYTQKNSFYFEFPSVFK